MRRRDAIAALVAERGDAITITTEQAIGAWRAAVPEAPNEIPDHLDVVGCMGSASSIGLGIALAQPSRAIIVVDADGSLLMQLGSMVTIAGAAPANLHHFVFENGVYETSGSQPLPAPPAPPHPPGPSRPKGYTARPAARPLTSGVR